MNTDEAFARRLFMAAISENRAGELLHCLFEGGAGTVDPEGKLVLITRWQVEQMGSSNQQIAT
jgi:hypothetical protein